MKKNLRIIYRHTEGFLNHSISYGFSRVLVLYPERLQSRKELVCMQRGSYSCCEIGLTGFPAALLSVAEMIYEAQMGAVSFVFLLFLPLCPVFIRVHCSRVFQEHIFLVKGQAIRPSGYKCVYVCIVKIDGVGDVVFLDVFSKFGPVLARSRWEYLISPMYSKILYRPHSACASGLRAEGKCHRSEASFSSVEDFRIENISSLHIPWCMAIRGSCRTGQQHCICPTLSTVSGGSRKLFS